MAALTSLSTWDLAVSTARLQVSKGTEFLRKVLEHWCVDYELHSSVLKQALVNQYFTTCSLLHMYVYRGRGLMSHAWHMHGTCRCLEEGLLPSLSFRNMARLYATARLLELTLCPSSPDQGMPRLQTVCIDNKTEENLNNLADDLDAKDFDLSPG